MLGVTVADACVGSVIWTVESTAIAYLLRSATCRSFMYQNHAEEAAASLKDLMDRLPDAMLMVSKEMEDRKPGDEYKSPTLKLNYCNKKANTLFNPNLGIV